MEPWTYPYESYEHQPPRYNRAGHPGPYQLDALERQLRLDEQRIAAEMEWESVLGISAPDF
jgi:hypothetical protein